MYAQRLREQNALAQLMELFETDPSLAQIAEASPGVVKQIAKYQAQVQRSVEVCEWVPDECEYACKDLKVYWKVKK